MSQLDIPGLETHLRLFAFGPRSVLILVFGCLLQQAVAAPGDLDPSYGTGGMTSLEFLSDSSVRLDAITSQPDGKLLLAGELNENMLVVRLTLSGIPDASFGGGDGIVTIDFAGGDDYAADLDVLSDGRIVVGGSTSPAGQVSSLAVARLNGDGSLDTTFSGDGKASVSQAVGMSAYRLVVQSDGKIALAGISNEEPSSFKFARLNADGTSDAMFGSGGIATVTFTSSASEVSAFQQLPSGGLQATGNVNIGQQYFDRDNDIVVMQLTNSGGLYSGFGNAGRVQIDYPAIDNTDSASAVMLLPDGKVMIAGGIFTFNTPAHALLVRLHEDGALDGEFGPAGFKAHRLAGSDGISSAGLAPSGNNLLVAGTARHWIDQPVGAARPYDRPFVARMNLDGNLDGSFGNGGIAEIGLDCSLPPLLAIQADGGLVIACRGALRNTIKVARLVSGTGDAAGVLGLSKAAFQEGFSGVCESCGSVKLRATRTGGRAGAVSVDYRTIGETATAGADFTPISGTLSWADGEDGDKVLSVPILPDTEHEGGNDETFRVQLRDATGLAPIAVSSTQFSISDDDDGTAGTVGAFARGGPTNETDGTLTIWATRSSGATGAISVNWTTASATAASGADFAAASGSLSWGDGESIPKPITIQLIDDNEQELSEVLDIDITAKSGGVNVFSTEVFFHHAIEDDDNPLFVFSEQVLLDLAALTDVNGNGSTDVATLVAGLEAGATVYVSDGASGDPISETTILDEDWRAIDLAVTPGGTGAQVAVLAQKDDGSITVAVHRARNGAPVSVIPFFGRRYQPSALAYVPNATGPGGSAFAVIAKNKDDQSVSVQLRKRSDGSLINTNKFFLAGWDAIDLDVMADINGNNRPELVVLARSEAGVNQVVIRDAETKVNINKIKFFGPGTMPKATVVPGDIGGGTGPEVTVLGELPDGRHIARNQDALTDEQVGSIRFFNADWTTIGIDSLADVNGNGSPDLAVLAQHDTTNAIKAQVRDALTGDLVRTVNFLGTTWSARAFAAFADIDGNGVQELGVAARDEDGDIRVQLRDAATGVVVSTMDLP